LAETAVSPNVEGEIFSTEGGWNKTVNHSPPPGLSADFQLLFESSPGLYLVLLPTAEFTIAAASNAYLHAMMARREAIVGRALFDVFPDSPLRASLERVRTERVTDVMPVGTYGFLTGGTERYWRPRNMPVAGGEGQLRYILHQLEDVTELKGMSSQAESNRLRAQLTEQVSEYAIFMLDPTGHVVSWNAGAQRLKGYTAAEIIGSHFSRFYSQRDIEDGKPARELAQASSQGHVEDEGWRIKKDGSHFWANVVITRLLDGDGQLIGFTKVTRDVTGRKRTEDQLRQWQHIFEHADWGVVIGGADSLQIELANPAFARMHGYTVDELVGRPLAEVFAPSARADLPRHLELIHQKGHHVLEAEHLRKDGTVFPALIDATAVKDDTGRVLYRAVHVRDLTDQKRAEARVRAAEAKFRGLVEASHDAIIITGQRGDIEFANAQALRWLGYREEELVGHPLALILPERFRHTHLEKGAWRLPAAGPVPDGALQELCVQRKNGTELPVEVSLTSSPAGDGERAVTTAIFRDVSEKKKTAQRQQFLADLGKALSESLEVETVFKKLAELAVPHLADWCVVDLLVGKEELRRIAVAHADPSKMELALEFQRHYKRVPDTRAGVARSVKTGTSMLATAIPEAWVHGSMEAQSAEIALRLGLRSYMIIPLQARGRVFGAMSFVAASRDFDEADMAFAQEVTGRMSLAVDNARLYQEAQRAVRARQDTIAIVSHDLKSPLNAILLNTSALRRLLRKLEASSPELHAKFEPLVTSTEKAAHQGGQLIIDLLDFGKMESGTFTVSRHPVELRHLLEEVLETFRPLALDRSITLESTVAAGGCTVSCDSNRVAQVVSNLVGNAFKFTLAGGQVLVQAEKQEQGALISVRDTGKGIAADVLPRIFERYWQPEESRRQGAGLGLSIAKGIVEAHGGRIWVESRPGAGTTFFFTLPQG
jgi:PAS domain S-box-containing protein